VLCLDRTTGKAIWRKVATEQVPTEGHHRDNDFASSSPTTDGRRLYVWFGSAGLYCYSLDGELIWKRDLGPAQTRLSFGEASSPMLHDGKLIVTRDLDSQSSITVFDAKTGDTIWRKERDEPSCWATPIVVEHEGIEQLITNAHHRVRSYDLANGDLIWQCGGQVFNVTPSPVTDGEAVYCMSGYRGSSAMALPLDATGDITDSDQIVWSKSRGTPYVPSPILYDGLLCFNQTNDAILTCLDAKTGQTLIERTRMPSIRGLYASPVGASNRVYFVGRNGVTLVLEKGPEFRVLATNKLDEPMDATPALVGNQVFLRSEKSLYCIGER
jgi:outer membrane protein assembly factor BamB